MRSIMLLIAALWALAATAEGGGYRFITYGTEQGLSNNAVHCVTQDNDGFIWIGTADGLNRFDGRHFRKYGSENRSLHGLDNTYILSLCVDGRSNIWAGTDQGIYIFDSDREVFYRFTVPTRYGIPVTGGVTCIVRNHDGKIWIGTDSQGIFIYDPLCGTLVQSSTPAGIVSAICHGDDGNMIAGTPRGGIYEYSSGGTFLRAIGEANPGREDNNAGLKALYHKDGSLWCGFDTRGLYEIKSAENGEIGSTCLNRDPVFPVRAVLPAAHHELMVGSDNGIYIFDLDKRYVSKISDPSHPYGVYDNVVNHLFRDREGGVWVATQHNGVNYIPRNLKPVKHFLGSAGGTEKKVVTTVCRASGGALWIGTDGSGVVFMDRRGATDFDPFANVPGYDPFGMRSVSSIAIGPEDDLWIGTANNGIYAYDAEQRKIRNYRYGRNDPLTINSDEVHVLFADGRGDLYVGTQWGLAVYDRAGDVFRRIDYGGNDIRVCGFACGGDGLIYIVSRNKGFSVYDPAADTWADILINPEHAAATQQSMYCVFIDSRQNIWVGAETGLYMFDREGGKLDRFRTDDGFYPEAVLSIEEDEDGSLWLGGNNGLVCVDTNGGRTLYRLTVQNGLRSNRFNPRASCSPGDGRLFFGNLNGMESFRPAELKKNMYVPPVYITELYVDGKPATVGRNEDGDDILHTAVHRTSVIRLPYNRNSVGLSLASLSYQAPAGNRYAYRLEGSDRGWTFTDRDNVQLNNLRPGKYTFRVRGSNDDLIWSGSDAVLGITVLKPFYLSTAAIILYLTAMGAAVFLVESYIRRRNEKTLREYRHEQEKRDYEAKIGFFTNLVHEIRTPLSLIKIPLEYILDGDERFSPRTGNYLMMMDKNAGYLLEMVTQLLDLRKNEDSEYTLNLKRCNVSTLVSDVCNRFQPVLEVSGITLEKHIREGVVLTADPDAIVKIITNLMSNASKYAESVITVSLACDSSTFTVSVSNDGQSIRNGDEKKIFNTFFQSRGSKTGTGIGLPLAKLLVEKHKGKIWLDNNTPGEVAFNFNIPLRENTGEGIAGGDMPDPLLLDGLEKATGHIGNGQRSAGRVMVVEDNDDMRGIIAEIIGAKYEVLTAANGKQALDILDGDYCDLIVSDVIMPSMNGCQLCEFVKSDMRYSHIPVILLSAKASVVDKIKGLEYGADAYMEKPFSPTYLIAQVDNLFENRQRLRERMNTVLPQDERPEGMSQTDAEFIRKLNGEIETRIQEESLYIEELAEKMFMSRSNFYRKIKALFDIAPNDYIKNYKLVRAAELLTRKDVLIKEIPDMTGFRTSKYFFVCFKKKFGLTPGQYKDKYSK